MSLTEVYVGLGSNIDKKHNVNRCLLKLRSRFGKIRISPIYQSKAIGMKGDDFYNLVVQLKTNLNIEELEKKLREIEYLFGRERDQAPHSPRTIDIDILLFGSLISEKHNIPRGDIVKYSFVLKPLCDIDPDLIHPILGESISSLWDKFDISSQQIRDITYDNLPPLLRYEDKNSMWFSIETRLPFIDYRSVEAGI